MPPGPSLNFGLGNQLKSMFFQYNAVICRAVSRVRKGGKMLPPPTPLNFKYSYGPDNLCLFLLLLCVEKKHIAY